MRYAVVMKSPTKE